MTTNTVSASGERLESTPSQRSDDGNCPECLGGTVTDEVRGEVVCRDCGLVVDETVLVGERSGPDDDQRTGAPTSSRYHDRGLATVIDGRDRDANGNALSARKKRQLRRLRTWNTRCLAGDGLERSLQFGLSELDRVASALELADATRETASVIFRRAHEAGVQRGRSLEATASAAAFAAARTEGLAVTMDDVAATSRVDQEQFVGAYRELLRDLSLPVSPPDPSDHVSAVVSDLDAGAAVERRARELLDAVKTADYHIGKHPAGVAAAAVYAASLVEDAGVTQAAVAEAADVCVVTIRNHYSTMLDAWHDEQ